MTAKYAGFWWAFTQVSFVFAPLIWSELWLPGGCKDHAIIFSIIGAGVSQYWPIVEEKIQSKSAK